MWHSTTILYLVLGGAVLAIVLPKLFRRLQLSRAKHPSLTGHARMARRIAAQVPFYEYDDRTFFNSDGATREVVERRRTGFWRLAELYKVRFPETVRVSEEVVDSIPDLRFVGRYRVPFQYSRLVRENLKSGSFLQSSSGVMVTDLDGNQFYDLTGSYGVNLLGYDFYKGAIDRGVERARDLGPVLGSYHPVIADNVRRLKEISGLDEVSFHMSGTEAVMQAVQLARYHTGRKRLVRFAGAYHGWWGEVQPGVGNPVPASNTLTLNDMSEEALRVIAARHDIACVLVNPLQALHPNAGAPADTSLVDSGRIAHFDRDAYGAWLKRLRAVCTDRKIVLIFDEIFVGFRLALRGAQEYFGVDADLVTYGKTLGGGLPVGAICGRAEYMKRFRDDRPADICFARGTFNSHPYVMTAMNEFLQALDTAEVRTLYQDLDTVWNDRVARLNACLSAAELPVGIANLSSIWTIRYLRPSRYNWMLQFYLRAEGLALSWVGTGRLIFSLDYTDADFRAVADRFVAAAEAMHRDGWWHGPALTNKSIRRRILKEMITHRVGWGAPQSEQ